MATPYRQIARRIHWRPRGDELKYLRREGNRMVRAQRRRRTALRMSLHGAAWVVAVAAMAACALLAARWAFSPGSFRLRAVAVQGSAEAMEPEIADLMSEWMGVNVLNVDLKLVEEKLRRHPWIGTSGTVRVQRKLPGTLVVTVSERTAGGLALVSGEVWLLDVHGMPIDRYGPRYARYDFPIVKGVDAAKAAGSEKLSRALSRGVEATRVLAGRDPKFYARISEIDVSDPDMVVLRLEDVEYDLRLSSQDLTRNLDNYLAIADRIAPPGRPGQAEPGGEDEEETARIEYVDLRWKDRIAVMPVAPAARAASVAPIVNRNGGR